MSASWSALQAIGCALEARAEVSSTSENGKYSTDTAHPFRALAVITAIGLAIRIYLALTSYAISADGVSYVAMAEAFASHRPKEGLASIFSPLYPWLMATLRPAWLSLEATGMAISVLLGSAIVPVLFFVVNRAFRSRRLALLASLVAALHPGLAEYSASVRTEAGYIFLTLMGAAVFLRGLDAWRVGEMAAAGLIYGLAYLYRTEAIGYVVLCPAVIALKAMRDLSCMRARIWQRAVSAARVAILHAAVFVVLFSLIAAPYVIYLSAQAGKLTVGREMAAATAVSQSIVDARFSGEGGQSDGRHAAAPPLRYVRKVVYDLALSPWYLFQALGPLLTVLFLLGLISDWPRLFEPADKAFLLAVFSFYFFGFDFVDTGPRFLLHLAPFVMGWVAVGLRVTVELAKRARKETALRLLPVDTERLVLAIVALALLPRTLWPIGYDLRGLRYAARDVALQGSRPGAVAAGDRRAAYYMKAAFVPLPRFGRVNLCQFLSSHPKVEYVILTRREELRFATGTNHSCLTHLRRYPRTGRGYFDLFRVRRDASELGKRQRSEG